MRFIYLGFIFIYINIFASNQPGFEKYVYDYEESIDSIIGVSAINLETGEKFLYNENELFPQASVVKLPIAIALLNEVEKGKIQLNNMVNIELSDLRPGSGYMGYFLTKPGLSMSYDNLLESMLAISDNSSTDIIISKLGGVKKVRTMLDKHKIDNLFVNRSILELYVDSEGLKYVPKKNERNLTGFVKLVREVPDADRIKASTAFDVDPRDQASPYALSLLLSKLQKGELLNTDNTNLLLDIMKRCTTTHRIRKFLPENWSASSKGGSWHYRTKIFNYTNDVAIVNLPNNQHLAMAILVKSNQSVATDKHSEAIANIAKYIFNYYKDRI